MEPLRDLAIVLRSVPYEDRHRVVTALTEHHGQITAMARNAVQSRRFGGAIEPFVASEWLFSIRPGAELYSLSEAQVRRAFEGLRRDFEKLALAAVFSELMMKFAPQREACPDLFKLHSNALAALEESEGPGIEISLLNAYLAKLLQWNGNQPQIHACLECGLGLEALAPDSSLSCLVADAGWVCPQCRLEKTRHVKAASGARFQNSFLRLSPQSLLDFQCALLLPIRKAIQVVGGARAEQQELFKFLEGLMAYHVPGFDQKPLKGLRFLDLESNLQQSKESPQQTGPGLL